MNQAPQWLIDRMEALKKLPPPTLEEVMIQMEASARQIERMALDDSHLFTLDSKGRKVIR